jgi:hypothetical protein
MVSRSVSPSLCRNLLVTHSGGAMMESVALRALLTSRAEDDW